MGGSSTSAENTGLDMEAGASQDWERRRIKEEHVYDDDDDDQGGDGDGDDDDGGDGDGDESEGDDGGDAEGEGDDGGDDEDEIVADERQASASVAVNKAKKPRKRYRGYDVEVIDLEDGSTRIMRVDDLMLEKWPPTLRVHVPFNFADQPIENGGKLYNKYLSILGRDFRVFGIDKADWRQVDSKVKEKIFRKSVMRKFDVDETKMKKALQKMGASWKNSRLKLYTKIDRYRDRPIEEVFTIVPNGVPEEEWIAHVTYRRSERATQMSITNTRNVAQQTNRHISGATSFAYRWAELIKEYARDGRIADAIDLYRVTHQRHDGTFTSPEAAKALEDMMNIREEQAASQQSSEEIDPMLPFRSTIGKKEHPGRVRGLGFGPTPTQLYGRRRTSEGSSQGRRGSNVDVDQLRRQLTAEFEASLRRVVEQMEERDRAREEADRARQAAYDADRQQWQSQYAQAYALIEQLRRDWGERIAAEPMRPVCMPSISNISGVGSSQFRPPHLARLIGWYPIHPPVHRLPLPPWDLNLNAPLYHPSGPSTPPRPPQP